VRSLLASAEVGTSALATWRLSYDVDSLDYTDPGPTAIVRTVSARVRPGSIVSLPLGHAGAMSALPAVLAMLRRRGLRAVTAGELLAGS
jgi:peptidoglycan/xylan/chitin deacetylase (PgdA/CDA1 family)